MLKPRDYVAMVEYLESVGIDPVAYVPAGLSNATEEELHSLFVHAVAEGYGYVINSTETE